VRGQCSAKTGDKVKELFDNVVLCALEGQEELRATAATSSSSSTTTATLEHQTVPADQRASSARAPAGHSAKGKEKAGEDEEETPDEPPESKFTRPGLSTEEQGARPRLLCVRLRDAYDSHTDALARLVSAERWENFHYWSVFGMENWYPLLKDYTFPTTLLPLTQEEAQAFVQVPSVRSRLSLFCISPLLCADECCVLGHGTAQYQETALKSLDQENLPAVTSPVLKHLCVSTRSHH
jgi:hypothetical protein